MHFYCACPTPEKRFPLRGQTSRSKDAGCVAFFTKKAILLNAVTKMPGSLNSLPLKTKRYSIVKPQNSNLPQPVKSSGFSVFLQRIEPPKSIFLYSMVKTLLHFCKNAKTLFVRFYRTACVAYYNTFFARLQDFFCHTSRK
jgi:hypothetical protein